MKDSIQKYGFTQPVVLDKNNEIIIGHTRVKAAIKLQMTEVPVVWKDDLSEDEVKALRILDNKSHEYSEWDIPKLKDEFHSLEEFASFNDTGFKVEEITNIWENEHTSNPLESNKKNTFEHKCPNCGHIFEETIYKANKREINGKELC